MNIGDLVYIKKANIPFSYMAEDKTWKNYWEAKSAELLFGHPWMIVDTFDYTATMHGEFSHIKKEELPKKISFYKVLVTKPYHENAFFWFADNQLCHENR